MPVLPQSCSSLPPKTILCERLSLFSRRPLWLPAVFPVPIPFSMEMLLYE